MLTELTSARMLEILDAANRSVVDEHQNRPLIASEGQVPSELNGVLYRNGPGRLELGGVRYGHPFDGDGHIVRLAFDRGRVTYTNRYVRTKGFVAEQAAGRMLYRGFGSNLPGGLLANALRTNFKNTANTNVIWHAGRLLALWEGGLPYRLDPDTLETLGPEDFGGRLCNPYSRVERALAPDLPFSAHPSLDEETGELINFGVLLGAKHRLMLYRVGADGAMAPPIAHPLPHLSFIHDFLLTRRYLIFLLPQVHFDLMRFLLGLTTPVGSLKLATERPMKILLIPRDGGASRTLECESGFVFHIAHGHECDDGRVVVDLVHHQEFPAFDQLEAMFASDGSMLRAHLQRLTIDPVGRTCEIRPWSDRMAELPRVAQGGYAGPRRYIYTLGAPASRRGPYGTCIQRLDTETGQELVREFHPDLPGEPVVVPRQGEGSGWVLTLVYRVQARRTDLVVLRVEDLAIVARLPFPHSVPPGFHGIWVDASNMVT